MTAKSQSSMVKFLQKEEISTCYLNNCPAEQKSPRCYPSRTGQQMLCLPPGEVLHLLTPKQAVTEQLLLRNKNKTLLTVVSCLLCPFSLNFILEHQIQGIKKSRTVSDLPVELTSTHPSAMGARAKPCPRLGRGEAFLCLMFLRVTG